MPTLFAFWRDFSRNYLTRLCQVAAAGDEDTPVAVPSQEEIDRLLEMCPPMQGFEYLNREMMENLWGTQHHFVRSKKQSARKGTAVTTAISEKKKAPVRWRSVKSDN